MVMNYMESNIDFLTESQLNLYTEMYYGKRQEFEICEMLFGNIRKKLTNTKKYQYINEFPENALLEKGFQKIFGFKKVHIHWEYKNIPNAYTIIGSHLHSDPRRKSTLIDKKNGYYDSSHTDVLFVCLYAGLLAGDDALTNDEILGVVLHEIGHNFDYSIFNTINAIVQTTLTAVVYGGITVGAAYFGGAIAGIGLAITSILETVLTAARTTYSISNDQKEKYYNYVSKEERLRMKYPYHKKAEEELGKICTKLHIWNVSKSAVFNTIRNVVLLPAHVILSPLIQFVNIGGKAKEQFADSFATSYGYGPSMIRGLNKLGKYPDELKNSSDFTKVMYDLGHINREMMSSLYECHGTNQERTKAAINKMKKDLAKGNFSPEMKADLMKEINELEELYQGYLKKDPEIKNGITVAVRKIVDTVFAGIPNIARIFKNQV